MTCFLHFWNIGTAPRGFFFDESAIAYNAYCIAQTGADEYGVRWPVFFRSFDIYMDPIGVYSAVLPIRAFGLREWAARLPSALYHLMACVAFFLLLRLWRFGSWFALGGSIVFSVIPWVFPVSRNCAYAGLTAAIFGMVTGLILIDSALRRRSTGRAVLAGAAWAFAVYASRSVCPVLALLAVGCGVVLWRPLVRRRRVVLATAISALVFLLPMIISVLRSPGALTTRFQQVNIFHGVAPLGEVMVSVASRYLDYFSPQFLLISGDPGLRHHTGRGGELYWCLAPLIVAGLYVVMRYWRRQPRYRIVLVGLLVSPVSAALTVDRMHSTRCAYGVIFWLLLAMLGARRLWQHKHVGRKLLVVACAVGAMETSAYLADYFGAYQTRCREAFETQLTEALRYCFGNLKTNETLYISDSAISALPFNENFAPSGSGLSKLEVDQSFKPCVYAHILFFGRIDPRVYQRMGIPPERARLYDGNIPEPGLLLRCNAMVAVSTALDKYLVTRNTEPVPLGADLVQTIPFNRAVRYEIYRIH